MTAPADAQPFSPRTAMLIVGAGVLAFLALVVLAAYAPDFRSGHDGRAHALSVSGDGYAALVELTDAIGSHSLMIRDPARLSSSALLIATPEPDTDPAAIDRLLAARGPHPTLIVLPKWYTRPLAGRTDWRNAIGMIPGFSIDPILAKLAPGAHVIQTPFPRVAPVPADTPRLDRATIGRQPNQQRIGGEGLVPLLLDAEGRIVLARIGDRPVMILAEPDLLNNQGIADSWTARAGWRMIDGLATDNEIAFDLTLNGFARARSPLRLMVAPPFLAVTLCVLAAGLLAGIHGACRFGAPVPPEPPIAPGKRALVDNAAMLFRAARKEHRVGGAYAALTRDLAGAAVAVPARLTGEALDAYLDAAARDAGDPPLATLAWNAETAEDRTELLGAARALYRWRRNRTR